MKHVLIILLTGVLIGFGCAKALDQPAEAEPSIVVPAQEMVHLFNPGTVFGLAHVDVSDGTDMDLLEKSLEEIVLHFNSGWEKAGAEIKNYLVKGERGDKEGVYGVLFVFKDLDTRNRFFPSVGENPSSEFKQMQANGDFPADASINSVDGVNGVTHLGDHVVLSLE